MAAAAGVSLRAAWETTAEMSGTVHRPASPPAPLRDDRIAVVIVVLDGRRRIARTLRHLLALPERPRVVVVDNGSADGTPELVEATFPQVEVVRLGRNHGAAGRNAGVAAAGTPYVAFAEDDSWYEPGALRDAADLLDAHPDVAVINAHVLVGADGRPEPLHADMVDTRVPERRPGLPGHRILSFLEGVSVVRRCAFEAVGGFDARLGVGGPEEHLAADLLERGYELRYVPWIRARHWPDHGEPSPRVRRLGLRNTLWFAWSRRPARAALRWTLHVLRTSPRNAATARGVADALRALPTILAERRPLPGAVEHDLALLDASKRTSQTRRYGP
jgi:N-acetylglucosaminyl-diphospho-decaprenol L-rhamnosyltransferase